MAALMVVQFRASPDAFVNRTAGGEGEMMMSALGKVRTAGTFSFVTGVVSFFSLATGYLVWAVLRRNVYRNWLLAAAGAALFFFFFFSFLKIMLLIGSTSYNLHYINTGKNEYNF